MKGLEFGLYHEHIVDIEEHIDLQFHTYIHSMVPWSHARRVPNDWNTNLILKRTGVVQRILNNMDLSNPEKEIDLTPLKDDLRVTGFVYGTNPLASLYDLTIHLDSIGHNFRVKWGGYKPELNGKRFVFYADNPEHAEETNNLLHQVSQTFHLEEIQLQYGIQTYQEYITIDESMRSKVKKFPEFYKRLKKLKKHPHFFEEIFK